MSSSTPQSSQTNGMAIAALVSSFFVSILGIILGFVALNQIKTSGEQGRGLALAGIILGFVAIVITILVIVISVATVASVSGGISEIQMGELG